ncbi:MAG TPA: EamA family transporter [Candidatus Butyricicoccus stercorigallinarum]|nr:EamA family transporter [Candidatus Butyricicoccus stercorigallinarum]
MSFKQSPHFGPFMMLCAALLFSTGGVLCKYIPWSPLAINGVRSLFSALVFALYFRITHHKLKCNRTVLCGALCMTGVTTLFIVANKLTTAANAIILQYTAPVWIILFMALLFHVRPTRRDILTCAVVCAGILCFFLDSLSSGSLIGNIIAVISGVFYGGLFLLNRFPEGDALSSMVLGQVLSFLLLAPTVVQETVFTPQVWGAVFVMGFFQVGVAYLCFSIGTKYTNPVSASLIAGIEPILNPILVAIMWGETIAPLSLLGAAIVVAAILAYQIRGASAPSPQTHAVSGVSK